MQRLVDLIDLARARFGEMPASTRGLVGTVAVILVLLLGYVFLFTAKPAYIPIGLSGSADDETRGQVVSYLRQNGIDHRTEGTEITVPASRQLEVLAGLQQRQIIRSDQIDFDAFIENDSVFLDRATKDRRYILAKNRALSTMVGFLDGVDSARVIIDQPVGGGGIGRSRIKPTATVTLRAEAPGLSRSQARDIAQLVAHAHAGLDSAGVNVSDATTGRSFRGSSDVADTSGIIGLEIKQSAQAEVKEKIEEVLGHIPGLKVAVNAIINQDRVQTASTQIDEPRQGVLRERSMDRTSSAPIAGGSPGVRANVASRVAGAGGGSRTNTESTADATSQPAFPNTRVLTYSGAGTIEELNAVIQVPRTWMRRVYQSRQGDPAEGAEPAPVDAAVLEAFAADELRRIEVKLRPLLDTDAAGGDASGTVTASMYDDAIEIDDMAYAMPGVGVGGGFASNLIGSGVATTASVVLLAVVSLALMLMVVRNASREPAMPSAEELVGIPPTLESDDEVVGEASDSSLALEGQEVDDDTMRRQQMLEYLNTFASEDPEEAASLIRKWMRADVK
ncbi:MAG: flagellar M-ring protein FliF C-terminal domain-containing protein [Phycisphaerales bacterium]